MDEMHLVDAGELELFATKVFEAVGMSTGDAAVSAGCMVQTNLWGVDSHGLMRLPVYVKRLEQKAVNPQPSFNIVKDDGGPLALLDGDGGLGYVVGRRGMQLAIEKAKKWGIGFVLANNSNHYGAAALYSRMAVAEGLIGVSATNVIPNIGVKGNKVPVTGNNPIALSIPLPGPFPFTLDISLSAVAGGKLLLAAKKGQKIPKDWAVTKDGSETDDPVVGFEGFLLAMGMHKGLGLSLFVDFITGVLGGGPFLADLRSMYKHPEQPSLTTHVFLVLDPQRFLDGQQYESRARAWIEMIQQAPMVDGHDHQLIPGELEYRTESLRRTQGIPLPQGVVVDLNELALRYGIPRIG
jgi:LDH2 family malate/lactate/ureidoglycolate dehydrogenase